MLNERGKDSARVMNLSAVATRILCGQQIHARVLEYPVMTFEIPRPCMPVPTSPHVSSIRGGVYLKYNAASESAYVSEYTGNDRGVLVQLAQQQFGLLPLGLFDEHKTAPPPAL